MFYYVAIILKQVPPIKFSLLISQNHIQKTVMEQNHNETYNKSIKFASKRRWLGRGKIRRATYFKRVCRAWPLTSRVKILIPGIRRAEG